MALQNSCHDAEWVFLVKSAHRVSPFLCLLCCLAGVMVAPTVRPSKTIVVLLNDGVFRNC